MTEAYNDALKDELEAGVWDSLKTEATSMSGVQVATMTADIAGIFDPTPISDGVGAILSVSQGDWLGAGLSVMGMIPYIGDAGKLGKIAKVAPKTAAALGTLMKHGDDLAKVAAKGTDFTLKQIGKAREKAMERVRKAMLDKKMKKPDCKDCKKLKGADGKEKELKLPATDSTKGKWVDENGNSVSQPTDGNGTFSVRTDPADPSTEITKLQYKDGFPDYGPHVTGDRVHIRDLTGNMADDKRAFKNMMRETDPSWRPPANHTLHHFEDGTIGYIPSNVHSGVAHTGGRSLSQNELF